MTEPCFPGLWSALFFLNSRCLFLFQDFPFAGWWNILLPQQGGFHASLPAVALIAHPNRAVNKVHLRHISCVQWQGDQKNFWDFLMDRNAWLPLLFLLRSDPLSPLMEERHSGFTPYINKATTGWIHATFQAQSIKVLRGFLCYVDKASNCIANFLWKIGNCFLFGTCARG